MSELADELARRAEPDHLKELASEKAAELKAQARERVVEKVDEVKTRAKEAVMRKTMDVKERADTPTGWSLLGALIGAGIGSVLMKKAFDARRNARYSASYESEGLYAGPPYTPMGTIDTGMVDTSSSGSPDMKARVSEAASTVKEKVLGTAHGVSERASGLMDQARDKASHLRERIPTRDDGRQAADWFGHAMQDNPLLLAVGGIALGVIGASFLPVTSRERQLLEPTMRKAKDSLTGSLSNLQSNLGSKIEEKLSTSSESDEDQDEELGASAASNAESDRGSVPELPPLEHYRVH
jgi:ElaB/YqjD/DUF883 family membrane-anchored ribosome-binding protein